MGASEADDPDGFSEWHTEYLSDGRVLLGHAVFNNAVELWAPDVRRFLSRWMPCPT